MKSQINCTYSVYRTYTRTRKLNVKEEHINVCVYLET